MGGEGRGETEKNRETQRTTESHGGPLRHAPNALCLSVLICGSLWYMVPLPLLPCLLFLSLIWQRSL